MNEAEETSSVKVEIPVERFYIDDPNAPTPNMPLIPGVSAVVFDTRNRILCMKRTRSDYWSLPGGRMDIGESAEECCVRETLEETGYNTRIKRLVSLNTHPSRIVHYPDGNVYQSFVICFEAEIIGGTQKESEEAESFRWVAPEEIDDILLIPDSRINALDAWKRLETTICN